jgi:predicted nuclease with TOPRIM domain
MGDRRLRASLVRVLWVEVENWLHSRITLFKAASKKLFMDLPQDIDINQMSTECQNRLEELTAEDQDTADERENGKAHLALFDDFLNKRVPAWNKSSGAPIVPS